MAEPNDMKKQAWTYLERMPVEQLEELLCQSADLPDDQRDETYIKAITEAIIRKEKERPTGRLMDAAEGWRQFERELNTPGDAAPIFPAAAQETEWPDMAAGEPAAAARKKRWGGWRWAAAAAIIVFLFVVVMPPAMGYANVFSMVGKWSEDIFQFISPDDTKEPDVQPRNEIYQGLQDALDSNGVTTPLVPRWAPEGYELEDVTVIASPDFGRTDYSALFCNGDKQIIMHLVQWEVLETLGYEKDETPVETYTAGDVAHYIFENEDLIVTVWQNDNFECSIQGKITVDELKKIIDSIYE